MGQRNETKNVGKVTRLQGVNNRWAVTFDNGCVEGGETVGNVVGPPLSRLTCT